MKRQRVADADALWSRHASEWRDHAEICSQWRGASQVDSRLLGWRVIGRWWSLLEELGVTLLVTREYEHLLLAMTARKSRRVISYFPLPHPSGVCIDRVTNTVFVASTRNPNQVYRFQPITGRLHRDDLKVAEDPGRYLVPVSSWFYPGCLYMHDLVLIGGKLHANSVGQNAVVKLDGGGHFRRVWWPKCIEAGRAAPAFARNYIQLNSIAAGDTLRNSFFSASSDRIGRLRPGHLNYPVDHRGVIFSGATREPICRGLTRPHSARIHAGRVWVNNSGYGELGYVENGRLDVVQRLPGWTRGLCFVGAVAFVGISKIIRRFAAYAPGLTPAAARCGVAAVCCRSGRILGMIEWPYGNQVFAIEWLPDSATPGLPFRIGRRRPAFERGLFYSFNVDHEVTG